jgi:hypothetical protein
VLLFLFLTGKFKKKKKKDGPRPRFYFVTHAMAKKIIHSPSPFKEQDPFFFFLSLIFSFVRYSLQQGI